MSNYILKLYYWGMQHLTLDTLISRFNKEQQEVIKAPLGSLAINAAAGTGKTSTLAARILYLQLEMNISADSIIALSFSRTARSRLLQKLEEFCMEIGMGSSVPVYTFHGLSYRILRLAIECNETWLRPNFRLIEGNEIMNNNFDYLFDKLESAKKVPIDCCLKILDELRQGSNDMDCLTKPDELPSNQHICWTDGSRNFNIETDDLKKLWARYNNRLQVNNCIDYCGLITEAIRVLGNSGGQTLKRLRNGLKYILVDEYQDTSRAQESLLFSISRNDICLNVVGDAGQTIYTFNGSSISNILNFEDRAKSVAQKTLPTTSLIRNYRSTENIIRVANRVNLMSKIPNKLIPELKLVNEAVKLIHAPSLQLAGDYVASEISTILKNSGIMPQEICVLVRKNTEHSPQGTIVMEALNAHNLSANVVRDSDVDHKREIRNYISQICMSPDYYGMTIVEFIEADTHRLLTDIPEGISSEDIRGEIIEFQKTGLEFCFEVSEEIYNTIESGNDPEPSILDANIQIRTIHSAKGEEYKVVFLLYLGDRTFPNGSSPDIDEERRLLYVGLTRAKEKLYVIGHPGIHFDSFFDECMGEGTELIEHYEFNSFTPTSTDDDKILELGDIQLINNAKKLQEKAEQKYKTEVLKFFQDDF